MIFAPGGRGHLHRAFVLSTAAAATAASVAPIRRVVVASVRRASWAREHGFCARGEADADAADAPTTSPFWRCTCCRCRSSHLTLRVLLHVRRSDIFHCVRAGDLKALRRCCCAAARWLDTQRRRAGAPRERSVGPTGATAQARRGPRPPDSRRAAAWPPAAVLIFPLLDASPAYVHTRKTVVDIERPLRLLLKSCSSACSRELNP
jgi:hypothetical protein